MTIATVIVRAVLILLILGGVTTLAGAALAGLRKNTRHDERTCRVCRARAAKQREVERWSA